MEANVKSIIFWMIKFYFYIWKSISISHFYEFAIHACNNNHCQELLPTPINDQYIIMFWWLLLLSVINFLALLIITCCNQQVGFVSNDCAPDFDKVWVEEPTGTGVRPNSSTGFVQDLPELYSRLRQNPCGALIQEQMIGHVGSSVSWCLEKNKMILVVLFYKIIWPKTNIIIT